ncbi:hypothetical protein PFNF54_00128 [Plasmodium falciparum NF54]|uniref:Surfin n=1 Tax=Plasmodium falciparum (isolate NF54) TaxID=5843 RepID=W7K1I8_PLAFO|nr:hypothetical protein PFNF54_00128 [Plasmodium falciparum NF54]
MHFVVEFQDWIKEPKDETISSDVFKRNFESKVENDLEELNKLSEDDYEKNCRHLNYLIDNIRELFFSSKNIRIPDVARKYLWDNQIEGNLKKLISSETKYKCQRNRINNPQKDRDLRIKVHDYCDERDKRLKDLTGKGSSEKSCYDFMVWVNQNKDSITRDYNNNMSGVRRRAGFFKISNACDLNKFESLFPQMDCSSKIYEKEEVLRGPKDVLEIHQGGDQNTVGQEDLLSGKRKEEKSRDKDKHKDKEKKPSDISEEIYGIGRDMSETFVSPKTPVVEEAVREYVTNDCVGDTCVVFDCTEGECNLIKGSSDDEEAEKERVPSSIDSSESYDGFNSLPPEKKKKDEETSVDVSSTKKCEREGCDTEQITKPRSQETERRRKRRNVPLHRSNKGPKNQGKKQLITKSIDGKGSHGSKNEGTSHSESSTSDKKTRKGRPEYPKKNRGGADSGEGRNKKDKRGKGKHRLTESGDEQLKRRKETISPEPPYHMRGGDSLTKDGNDMEDREFSSGNYSDESETNSDSYQGVQGTIEVRQGDDGKNSIFGIPFPNFFDYTDFNLSDFSLSNIPYPTIHIPFFPRSPRIYKGLYGGISRVRPNPTHINIDTYKAVDSVSELVNRLRDKADSKEKKRDKPDTCGDVGRDESDRPGEQEDVNRRGNGDKKDEAERTKESKDSTGRHSDTGEGTIRSSDSSDASTEDSSKTSGRTNEDGDLSKGNEIPPVSEPMMSQVLSMNSVETLASLPEGKIIAAPQYSHLAQTMNDIGVSVQGDSAIEQQQGKGPTTSGPTTSGPTRVGPTSADPTNEVGTSTSRARRSIQDPYPKEFSTATTKGNNYNTHFINKTNQSSSSFFDFSSLTKNILISLAIFGVIFLFIFSNKHRSLGMFNKKKKKRSRKSILIKEDNMNSMMLERYEDIDEEQNEKKNIYEEEHEDDENDDKLNDDDCDDIEFNKSGMI